MIFIFRAVDTLLATKNVWYQSPAGCCSREDYEGNKLEEEEAKELKRKSEDESKNVAKRKKINTDTKVEKKKEIKEGNALKKEAEETEIRCACNKQLWSQRLNSGMQQTNALLLADVEWKLLEGVPIG